VELSPVLGGGTRVVVTEAIPAHVPVVRAHASARTGSVSARRSPAWVHCARDRWDARLLGLELLFVAARAGIA
jgi:hypothetical protein